MRNNRDITFLIVALAVLWFVAPLSAQNSNCRIGGRVAVEALQGKNIAVLNMNTGKSLASTKIKDSVFTLDISVAEPFVAMLKTDPQNGNARSYYFLNIVAEAGSVYADLVTDSISGTPLNDRYNRFAKHCRYEVSVINAYYQQMRQATATPDDAKDLEEKASVRYDKLIEYVEANYKENKDNPIGALAMELLIDFEGVDYESAMELLKDAAPVVTSYQPLVQKLAKMEILSHTAVGREYIDLDLTDYKTGKPIKLSKVIKGKVALIDFWASWCGPCRREIPNLAKIHEKYGNNKDFVLVSLNVWDKPDAQAKAIKELKMEWTQLTDSTRNATDTYGVEGIPQILLIDKDGIILARDLRGADIEKEVKTALGH